MLYCMRKKCPRSSYLEMAYGIESRVCTVDEIKYDICSGEVINADATDTTAEAKSIYEIIKKCNDADIPITTEILAKVLTLKKKVRICNIKVSINLINNDSF